MRNFYEGEIICIDKPYRMSSFGALVSVNKFLRMKAGDLYKI